MQGKILGVPLVLLFLVVLIVVPLLFADLKLSQQVAGLKTLCSIKPAVSVITVTPTATPSATPVLKHVVAPATSSGEVK